eukprot:TRINITY_DN19256_c0_g1_i1.p1 TRINITY_DN19256_c0_g1~~TRINITY_DN19256_c0_g1_i1.p1  ORF type:complete len:108 (+),score=15.26 TRINITY_DN19256_c0_g1_i1:149-472(+)
MVLQCWSNISRTAERILEKKSIPHRAGDWCFAHPALDSVTHPPSPRPLFLRVDRSLFSGCRSRRLGGEWLARAPQILSLIHISEPTRLLSISYAVFCLKKKKIITLK